VWTAGTTIKDKRCNCVCVLSHDLQLWPQISGHSLECNVQLLSSRKLPCPRQKWDQNPTIYYFSSPFSWSSRVNGIWSARDTLYKVPRNAGQYTIRDFFLFLSGPLFYWHFSGPIVLCFMIVSQIYNVTHLNFLHMANKDSTYLQQKA
jgi:hypothetical protein